MFDWFGQNGFHDSIALHCFNVLHTTSSSSSIAFSCIQSHSIAISMWILFPTWKKDCVGKLDGFDFPWKQNKQWQRVRNTPFNWLDPDANIFHVSLDDLPILFYESPIFAASMCILFVTVRWFHHLVGPPNSRCWTPSVSLVRELVKSTAHISVLSLNFQSHMINTRINKGPFRVFFLSSPTSPMPLLSFNLPILSRPGLSRSVLERQGRLRAHLGKTSTLKSFNGKCSNRWFKACLQKVGLCRSM